MPEVKLVSRTDTSLTCEAVDLPENAYGVNWYIGTSADDMPFVTSCDGDTVWTFDGLQSGTLYYVKFLPYDASQNRLDPAVTDSFATLWEWDSDVSSGEEFCMTAAEFNRFIDLIFDVAAAKSISLSGSASSYNVTAGTDMLASQVNAVRSLISDLDASVPEAAYAGGDITASFFNGLVNSLYSIT